jgi:tetratricopeptide (TPR) repeat protein
MKKILCSVFVVAVFSSVNAQAPKAVPAQKGNSHLKVFGQAISVGDINTAVIALNYYIAEQGANNNYADTLAMLYMQQGSFEQCYYWADKRLAAKPDDNGLMEMKGVCLDKLQQPKEAIAVFEKLLGKTKSPYHAYKLMELQYGIKRLAECVSTGLIAEKLQFKPEYTMTYNVGEQTGRTYLQASMYNIQALALYDLDRKADAKMYFQKALALDSNFVLAKQNLAAVIATEKTGGAKINTPAGNVASPANKQN